MKTKTVRILLTALLMLLIFCSCTPKNPDVPEVTAAPATEPSVTTEAPPVTEEPTILDTALPESLDYGNATVTFLLRDAYKDQFCIEGAAMNDVDAEVVKRQETVEELLNLNLKFQTQDGSYGKANEAYLARVRADTLANAPEINIYDLYGYYAASLAVEGCFQNLHAISTLDPAREYWNASLVEETTYNNVIYLISGPICLTETQNTVGLVYNKNMLGSLHPDLNLYQKVDSGEWTYELFGTLLADVYDSKGTPDVMDDRWGLGAFRIAYACDAILVSGGMNIIERDAADHFSFTFQKEDTVNRFGTLYDFLHRYDSIYDPARWNDGKSMEMFQNGNMLFMVALFDHIASISAENPAFRYGILPLPKLNKTDAYATNVADYQSYLALPVNMGASDSEMIGALLETMACYSNAHVRPAFFDRMCKERYSDQPDDARMFDLINESIVCNFGQVYSSALGNPLWGPRGVLWKQSNNYTEQIGKYMTTYQTKLGELIEKMDIIG